MVTQLELVSWLGDFDRRLREKGFVCEMHTDFGLTNQICAEMGKPYSSRIIDPLFNDFTRDNCFWLIIRFENRPIGCLGVRKDVLAGGEFISFLDRQYARIYFGQTSGVIDTALVPPVFRDVKGAVAYFGDLFLVEEFRSGRNGFDLGAMIMLAKGLALMEFRFDWLIAFIREPHAVKGYGALYRTAFQYPEALRWLKTCDLRADSDWVLCSRSSDVEYLVKSDLRARG